MTFIINFFGADEVYRNDVRKRYSKEVKNEHEPKNVHSMICIKSIYDKEIVNRKKMNAIHRKNETKNTKICQSEKEINKKNKKKKQKV